MPRPGPAAATRPRRATRGGPAVPTARCVRPLLVALVGSLSLLLAVRAAPVGAEAAPRHEQSTAPFAGVVTNPCGEDVEIAGQVVVGFVGVVDAAGGHHGVRLEQWRNVTAVGVESGTPYRVVWHEAAGGSAGADLAPFGSTEVTSFLLVSQGGGTNLVGHGTIHFQVDANGEPTAEVVFHRGECVG